MTELIRCLGVDSPPGETYTVESESQISLREHRHSARPLSQERFDLWLEDLRVRGVCLDWTGWSFVLSWRPFPEWPYRDPMAWRDVERVRANFEDLVRYFGLKTPKQGIDPNRPLSTLTLVFCDVETTRGQKIKGDRLIELGLCRREKTIDVWYEGTKDGPNALLIDPEEPINTTLWNGITDGMVRGKPKFPAIAEEVFALLEGAVFVSHSTNYIDERSLALELSLVGIQWTPAATLNTCKLAKRLLPRQPDHKLQGLAERLQLPVQEAHRAKSDVLTTIALWEHLQEIAAKLSKPPTTLADYLRI